MNFFNIDQHISGILDCKDIFPLFGHTIKDVCMSGHAALLNRQGERVPMLQGDNWCGVIGGDKWDSLYEKYGDMLSKYDAFLTFYPPIFSVLYEKFDKPILVYIPIRYEYGVDGRPELWEKFNEFLRKDNIILVANSLYDQKYTESFVGKEVTYIPNLCEYTKAKYNPINDSFIYYAGITLNLPPAMTRKHDALKFGHSWQDVCNYKGIIHFPYQVSTMSMFEQYMANVPLFYPTKRYLLELIFENKLEVMHHTSWNQLFKRSSKSAIPFNAAFDPNNYSDKESVEYWLQFADFYNEDQFPFITYFDSFEDICAINDMSQDRLNEISLNMQMANKRRKELVLSQWGSIL
jgi:hypothetical protein